VRREGLSSDTKQSRPDHNAVRQRRRQERISCYVTVLRQCEEIFGGLLGADHPEIRRAAAGSPASSQVRPNRGHPTILQLEGHSDRLGLTSVLPIIGMVDSPLAVQSIGADAGTGGEAEVHGSGAHLGDCFTEALLRSSWVRKCRPDQESTEDASHGF
jgi:hypothetical protein